MYAQIFCVFIDFFSRRKRQATSRLYKEQSRQHYMLLLYAASATAPTSKNINKIKEKKGNKLWKT